jgi:DNA-binding Lrp family transcriptional regulator
MGRGIATEPLPVAFIQQALDLRQDGTLCWRERPRDHFPHRTDDCARFNNQRANGSAGYPGSDGKLMLQFNFEGRTRRIAAARVAWCLSHNEWPRGQVKTVGDEGDLRPENLIVVKRGVNPAAVGTSSLKRRAEVDAKLIEALANHPHSSVACLGQLAGLTESAASTRLSRLAARGVAQSPMCCPNRSWVLTAKGQTLAETGSPLIDDLDRRALTALALVGMGTVKLARRVGCCPLTIKRRVRVLVERGLVFPDVRKYYAITDAGRQALGDDMPQHQPWIDPSVISAAAAKDVLARSPGDDRTRAFRSKVASLGAQRSMEAQRLSRREGFNNWALTG